MSLEGVCAIKSEYVIPDYNQKIKSEKQDVEANGASNETENSEEPANKKVKLETKKKARGQNKARRIPFKRDLTLELCKQLIDIAEGEESKTCSYPNCKFIHNVEDYLKSKPADVGNNCYNFDVRGRCPRGLACRFGSAHTSKDGKNIVNKDIYEKYLNNGPQTINILSQELQTSLRKRTYDFKKVDAIVQQIEKSVKNAKQNDSESDKNGTNENVETNEVKTSGTVSDEDIIKLRTSEKKKIQWRDKLLLSPLTTVGNLPFRRICKEYGADITCGEMAMSVSLLQGHGQEWALAKKHKSEDIFGVQLCGNKPHLIAKAAQLLQDHTEIDFVDLNLGCPIDLVYQQGAGSGLLRKERVLESVIRSTSQILDVPLTIKTRTGIYADKNIAHELVPKFRDWGASMVTVHGRSREQRYTKMANWDYINKCASLAAPLPVFGNGDILSYEDYKYARETYKHVSGVTIGRGALIKPWIFTEIKEQKLWDIRSSERFEIIKKYANYGLEHWGSDTKGVENTRRFLLEWLSFLYRYVPVGILENPPQKINERPPYYRGRDDLETLMASPNCADWIKISEMVLGPVPENFNFLPKHKANSYQ
ncbi:tRNA-dihydrouridine(47) synthase [NAD(P)(+)]-like [Chrysoperla carnea]|uniref:tRNA-dihydrouridine(47) synthase [NAD(P)(+)]-like n=1 Tax=Chrysoperla carnea TaxID=189513 RepID=UPI001D071A48|nr:tRNA-dihydrouridine(47) synthase [NAD(P)(+)]-like [Chrysoperla carnea]